MWNGDRAYYRGRAEQEVRATKVATNALAAAIHQDLADRYAALADSPSRNGVVVSLRGHLNAAFGGDADSFHQSRQSERA